MRELELSKTKEINLRTHGWIQHHTTEDLEDDEHVLVKGVGECRVRGITKGLVELWKVDTPKKNQKA